MLSPTAALMVQHRLRRSVTSKLFLTGKSCYRVIIENIKALVVASGDFSKFDEACAKLWLSLTLSAAAISATGADFRQTRRVTSIKATMDKPAGLEELFRSFADSVVFAGRAGRARDAVTAQEVSRSLGVVLDTVYYLTASIQTRPRPRGDGYRRRLRGRDEGGKAHEN